MTVKALRVSIESRLDRVALLGRAVRAACDETKCSDAALADLELCVVEAVTNAVQHAYLGCPGQTIVVDVRLSPTGVELVVTDRGLAFDPERLDKEGIGGVVFDPEDVEALPESGFGLCIIKSVMDEVSYHSLSGRNVLRLRKTWDESVR